MFSRLAPRESDRWSSPVPFGGQEPEYVWDRIIFIGAKAVRGRVRIEACEEVCKEPGYRRRTRRFSNNASFLEIGPDGFMLTHSSESVVHVAGICMYV